MEDSLVEEEGVLVKFPSVPFATFLLHLQLLLLLFNEVWKACRPYLLPCRDL